MEKIQAVNLKFIFDIIDSNIDVYKNVVMQNIYSEKELQLTLTALENLKSQLKDFIKEANKL